MGLFLFLLCYTYIYVCEVNNALHYERSKDTYISPLSSVFLSTPLLYVSFYFKNSTHSAHEAFGNERTALINSWLNTSFSSSLITSYMSSKSHEGISVIFTGRASSLWYFGCSARTSNVAVLTLKPLLLKTTNCWDILLPPFLAVGDFFDHHFTDNIIKNVITIAETFVSGLIVFCFTQ